MVGGGGNSAGQAALHLAKAGCDVTLVVRADNLAASMSSYLATRITAHPRITLRSRTIVSSLHGERALAAVTLRHAEHGASDVRAAGLFSFIGANPGTGWLVGELAIDDRWFIRTDRDLDSSHLGSPWRRWGETLCRTSRAESVCSQRGTCDPDR